MNAETYLEISYFTYLMVSIAVTIWVARTLFRGAQVFLIDAFAGNAALADSVNRLLVVGFYLVNLGYVCLMLSSGIKPVSATGAIEFLSNKLGLVLLILGGMHFFNMYVLSRMRRRALEDGYKPKPPPHELSSPWMTDVKARARAKQEASPGDSTPPPATPNHPA